MKHSPIKQNGVHYTPAALARFLAAPITQKIKRSRKSFSLLDPACGDGELLKAVLEPLSTSARKRVHVIGYEKSKPAAESARFNLATLCDDVEIRVGDFLSAKVTDRFDGLVSNPPYVRTQVLGAKQAQQLSRQFGLSGRVDLYQVFALAMSRVLVDGGLLALLTSNRFLTVKSGKTLRSFLKSHFQLQSIIDLGDTRLFSAAVLPVIVTGIRSHKPGPQQVNFTRVYTTRSDLRQNETAGESSLGILDAIRDPQVSGKVTSGDGEFNIERGTLKTASVDETWTLTNKARESWLNQVVRKTECTFSDVAEIRVGIKTTADSVFIRDNWRELEKSVRPERRLLRPLITHHDAQRWVIDEPGKRVLYPHKSVRGKRLAVDLSKFPAAEKYLNTHYERLANRKYLIDGGRNWYEIWVPQNPADWATPKLVWPDISEQPRFFFDDSAAIVNGDCYWIKLKPEVDPDWLYLMLAVGNSSVATEFYDTMFHNKLYAGRRRFMTQYVQQFPLPPIDSQTARQIIGLVKKILNIGLPQNDILRAKMDARADQLVKKAFGVSGNGTFELPGTVGVE